MEKELPAAQTVFRKGRGTTDIIAGTWWIIEKKKQKPKIPKRNQCVLLVRKEHSIMSTISNCGLSLGK